MRVARYHMYGIEHASDGTHYKFNVLIPSTAFPLFKVSLESFAEQRGYKVNFISYTEQKNKMVDCFFSLVSDKGNSITARRVVRLALKHAKCFPLPMWR